MIRRQQAPRKAARAANGEAVSEGGWPAAARGTGPTRQAGFTLLEILITIAIMSMLITAAVQAFQSITHAEERAQAGLGRSRSALVLLDRVERELVGTVLVPQVEQAEPVPQPYIFLASDRTTANSDTDAVRFVTLTASRAPASPPASGPRVVTYSVREAAYDLLDELDQGDRLELVRQEDPLSNVPEREIIVRDGQVVAEDVASFRLRYKSESGAWLDGWDSSDTSSLDELPLSVEVAVRLWEQNPDGDLVHGEEYSRTIELPLRPVDFLRPEGQEGAEACGKTLEQCWREDLRDVVDLMSATGQRVQDLYESIPPPTCWNSDSPDMLSLKAALEELEDVDDNIGSSCE